MEARVWFLKAEPCEHSIIIIALIGVSGYLKVICFVLPSGTLQYIHQRSLLNSFSLSFGHLAEAGGFEPPVL